MEGQIICRGIEKTYTVYRRPKGSRNWFSREKEVVRALENISFSIQEGELVGYIGPNGAGKSTTVKVMSGILTPDAGECRILGRVPWKERREYVGHIGVVFGQRSQLWWDVPAGDSLELLRDIYGIPEGQYQGRLQELSRALDLEPLLKTPVRQLSLGQRMRCEVAAALLHSPRILFLDEPTIGLDAVSKLALREFLQEENQKHGVTMILTTHDMADVEALCSRVMTIGRGKLLYDGGLASLKKRFSPLRQARVRLSRPVPAPALPGNPEIILENTLCTVRFDPEQVPVPVMTAALAKALPIEDLVIEEQDLDRVIAAMYQQMNL